MEREHMLDKEEITLALAAHALWRTRLKQHIEAGDLTVDLATLRAEVISASLGSG